MPGLHIYQKSNKLRHTILGLLLLGLVAIGGLTLWWMWQYYTTGAKPPLPASLMEPLGSPDIDETPVTDQQKTKHTVPANQPRYVSIPSLGIDKVRVFGVGLTKEGAVDAPNNIHDAAWFNQSASPGDESGVVLIDAHNGGATQAGVFADLGTLAVGEKVTIERGDGEIFNYTIVENRTVSIEEANKTGMKRVLEPYDPNKEGLGLITCAGVYVPKNDEYSERVLVRAVADNT